MRTHTAELAAAYESCLRDARAHYENFPVASLLVPRTMRPHIAAVYAFARAADDFADEGQWFPDERLALLDGWLLRLRNASASEGPGPPARAGEPPHTQAIFRALGATMHACDLPLRLFEDLVSAFRQDVTVTRYATWEDLLDYCSRSANPIGRLVLEIAGYRDAQRARWSDAICSALQLTNFWQDVLVDFERGRVYLPAEERHAHGAREEDLAARRMSHEWQAALLAAAVRTRRMFEDGRPLCTAVTGRLRHELRATWLGGTRILDRLARADPIRRRPTMRRADVVWVVWRLLTWREQPLGQSAAVSSR